MRLILYLLPVFICIQGCFRDSSPKAKEASVDQDSGFVSFAQGFRITRSGLNTLITVTNPWQHASGVVYKYELSDTAKNSSIVNAHYAVIKTPVTRVVCLSTTHIGFIGCLQKTRSVTGISGKDYVVDELIRQGISENKVLDVGYDENLNYELILKMKPDVVFAYGVNMSVSNTVKKLNELGIPVILIGEYLEEDPLGKMEWLKVFGAFFGMQSFAAEKFDSAVNRYQQLKEMASVEKEKPSVLLGLPWRGTWYVSGGKSYIARLVSDAGGDYIWKKMDFNESRPLGLEMIFENALSAEYWINPGEARSLKDINNVDERFSSLPSLVSKNVFNNDKFMSLSGGNAFYETGVVEPDVILSDLITILHPHLLPSYRLKYYRKLQ